MKILKSELDKGYQYRKGNIAIHKEYGVFHVKGFDLDNNYVWESFDNFNDAKNYFKLL